MTTRHSYYFSIAAVLSIILCGFVSSSADADKAFNPHWTGKHCAECHIKDRIPERRFGGNVVELCNRCHSDTPPVCTKVHTKNTVLPDAMKRRIPSKWPLTDSEITCLTCHAAKLQMYANEEVKEANRNFLRNPMAGDIFSFCFNCHQKERFQKTNPHRENVGTEIRTSCFLCHTRNLASNYQFSFEKSLKTKSPSLCLGCHFSLPSGHIVHEQTSKDLLRPMGNVLHKLEQEGFELPLADGRMHCATCHNPHPLGIIGRKEAAIGEGEKYLLRIPDAHTLCAACHPDSPIEEYLQRFMQNSL